MQDNNDPWPFGRGTSRQTTLAIWVDPDWIKALKVVRDEEKATYGRVQLGIPRMLRELAMTNSPAMTAVRRRIREEYERIKRSKDHDKSGRKQHDEL